MLELSKSRKYCLLAGICLAFLDFGFLISLQPTFYPTEAEKKGARPSQYGFVFGIVSLAAFFSAPLWGRYGDRVGAKLLYNAGAMVQGLGGIAFGLLEFVDDTAAFIGLSYLLRFLEGVANAACTSAVSGILIQMFPDNIASMMGYTRMFLAIGYMLGPVVGSALYSFGGFGVPFYLIGSVATVVAVYLIIVLPKVKSKKDGDDDETVKLAREGEEREKSLTLLDVLRHPSLWIPFLDAFTCFTGNGMTEAMLEPHLKKDAGATQSQVAITFFLLGAMYLVTMPAAGYLADRVSSSNKVYMSVAGNALIACSFVLVGPLPFIPVEPSVAFSDAGVVIAGVGYGIIIVSSFARAHSASLDAGYANDIRTNLIVSGLWAASFNLGAFTGPTSAGFMVEAWGFRTTTAFYICIYLAMVAIDSAQLAHSCWRGRRGGDAGKEGDPKGYQQLE